MIAAEVVRLMLAPRMRAFRRRLADPATAQRRVLKDIVARLARTARGRELGVDARDDYDAFANKVPIVNYDQLAPWIEKQIANEGRELVDEPVLFYEPTSGSTAPAKFIPTTATLRRAFSHTVALWLHDILAHGPRLETGRFYFVHTVTASAGDDLAYAGRALESLIRRYVVDLDGEPEVVSVWNPSYLLAKVTRPMPSVKLISCWSRGAEALRPLFPNAMIQPKGLLATETPVTLPLFEANGFVPLVDDVYIELFDGARARPLHEAEPGRDYELIVSQRAGLVRYRLGDRVRATHFFEGTPCLELMGRADDVVDLAGEKLSEGFARSVVATVTGGGFGVVVPDRARGAYVVIVDRNAAPAEELLMESPRYAEARRNGQLGAARVVVDHEIQRRLADRKPDALIRSLELAAALIESHAPHLQ